MRLPEPTRNLGHTIFHSEIFHDHYALNKIQLRHLIDVVLIRARHEKAINWDELDRRFSAAGAGEVLATYLHLAGELLGQTAPQLSHAPRRDALAGLRSTESRDGFQFQIERLQSACDGLLTRSSLLQSELENAKRAQAQLERKLAAILTSRSWRIAAPLRGIANTARSLWRGLCGHEGQAVKSQPGQISAQGPSRT